MYYIDDYRRQAINTIVPYLIEFPQIVSIIENSADRYQAIEDVLWKIANNFKVADSRGVFLNAHAHNEVVDLVYTDKARDAFTYGTEYPETQAFGTGHFYSQASYISGIPKDVSEEKLIRAVQEKIIQNNTNGTIEDFIEAMKLHFNASKVEIYESYPLAISLTLSGDKLELSSSGNKEAVKKCLPACVALENLYINDGLFDQFIYSTKSGYANDSRYPITLGNSDYMYRYISTAVNLNSTDNEYVNLNSPFFNVNFEENVPFECIIGHVTNISNNATIYSFTLTSDKIYKIAIKIKLIDGKYYFAVVKSEWDEDNSIWVDSLPVNTEVEITVNKDYTLLMTINRNTFDNFRLWVFDGVKLGGQNSSQDSSWAYNMIQNNNNYTQVEFQQRNGYSFNSILNSDMANTNLRFRQYSTSLHSSGKQWVGIACNNNKFIAISQDGYVSISNDCTNWSEPVSIVDRENPSNGSLFSDWKTIAYGNNKFVATNGWGYVAVSTDGITWTTYNSPSTLKCITFGNNMFLTIDERGYIYVSDNGINWRQYGRLNPVVQNQTWDYVAYGNGVFVAIGDGFVSVGTPSSNAITWSTPDEILPDYHRYWGPIVYGLNRFIAIDGGGTYIATSTDGINWDSDTVSSRGGDLTGTFGNGAIILLSRRGEINISNTSATSFNNYSDFTYYAILGGSINKEGQTLDDNSHYYVTCFGEKNILFNCFNNSNHKTINTNSTLQDNLTVKQSGFNYKKWHSNSKFLNIKGLSGQPSVQWSKDTAIDALINSFELSFDICLPFSNYGDIINGIIGSDSNLKISYNLSRLEITLPTYTSGNVEVPYTLTIYSSPTLTDKFKNIKLVYNDNTLYVYVDNVLKSTQNILNVNLRYLSTILELGPINAFIRNLNFNCVYSDGINVNTLEYNLPLTSSLYEENNLLQPSNTNARFLTIPQLIDNTTNQDLFGNETLRRLN